MTILLFRTRETVAVETPDRFATSLSVAAKDNLLTSTAGIQNKEL
jgi:hypothetical protein